MKEISERFWNSDQSWHFERIVSFQTTRSRALRLRVLIRRNAYDEQSYIRGYVLDPNNLKWNELVHKPIEGARCESASYTNRDSQSVAPFQADAWDVLNELTEILA